MKYALSLALAFLVGSSICKEKPLERKECFNKKYEQIFKEQPSKDLWNKLKSRCNSTGGCSAGSCKM